MREPVDISVFTPSRTDPEVLEAITVQRLKLLDDTVARVRESILTRHKHHLLFVGPRGSGKTHLITLIENRVKQDAELGDRMHVAWLNEDETCTTPLEFLSRIFRALGKRYPDCYNSEKFEPAYELKPNDAFNFLQNLLKETLAGRTLLILVENLDAIFEALGSKGQKALRAMIQEDPVFCIVSTAQRLVNGLSSRESPFFGFFQTEHLKFLTVQEATELLLKIATHNEQDDVVEFLSAPRGEARVRALHHLSGGNHRVFIVLSQFITRKSIDSLVAPFLKMVDELTPYYQERLRWLPALQRKIVELLCRSTGTVAVKDIAKPLFSTNPTIAKQLAELRQKGYVESSKRGRESLYEVAEPLMRICTEIKENQSPGPLALLVDFLRVWYDEREMTTWLGQCAPNSVSRSYLTSALARNHVEGNLRKHLLKCSLESDLLDLGSPEVVPHAEKWVDLSDELGLAFLEWQKENTEKALGILESVIDTECDATIKAHALRMKGSIFLAERKFDTAFKAYDIALSISDASPSAVEEILSACYALYILSGDSDKMIESCTTAVTTHISSANTVALALFLRGTAYCEQGKQWDQAISDFSQGIDLADRIDDKSIISGLLSLRALLYEKQNKVDLAIADYNRVLNHTNTSVDDKIMAHLALASLAIKTGDWATGVKFIQEGFHLKQRDDARPSKRISLYIDGIVESIFRQATSPTDCSGPLAELASLFNRFGYATDLGDALIKHLGSINKKNRPSNSLLERWLEIWEPSLANHAEYEVVLRLLKTGVRFLMADGDKSVLLDLVKPEREILYQAFGLSAGA